MMNMLTTDLMYDRRLALMQLSDSFFPSGSFTLSHGLEALHQLGQIQSVKDFEDFLRLLLRYKVAPSDLVALIHAYRASNANDLATVRQADLQLFAQTPIQETREAQRKNGRALLMVAQSIWQDAQLETLHQNALHQQIQCLHPIIFAVVGRTATLSESDTILAFLHSLLTSLVSAAIRLGILGHIQAQVVLKTMASDIEQVIQTASTMTLDEMWSCTPAIDIAQMRHAQFSHKQFMN
jgi:urease accessory protein